jgi:hypothetical protein
VFTSNTVFLSWQPASDAEQTNGLTYNVRLGSSPGAADVLSPMSATNGFRLVPKPGNAAWLTGKLIHGLQRGQTYYWSVQAVDNCYAGSSFAVEASFTLGEPPLLTFIPDQAMDEDGWLEVLLAIFDMDGDINAATVNVRAQNEVLVPPEGLRVSGTGTNRLLRIQPGPDQNGTTTIEVSVLDAQGGFATGSFALTVHPVNDPPRVQNLHLTLAEDTSQSFTLIAEDPEGDPLSYSTIRLPGRGQLVGTAPHFTYLPRTNFFGDDWCEFWISDNHDAGSALRVSFEISPVPDVVDPRLSIRLLSDGSPFLSLPVEPYQLYTIETSTNLLDWVTHGSYITFNGLIEFFGLPAPPGVARFYRARAP